jgi:hypothetical protein
LFPLFTNVFKQSMELIIYRGLVSTITHIQKKNHADIDDFTIRNVLTWPQEKDDYFPDNVMPALRVAQGKLRWASRHNLKRLDSRFHGNDEYCLKNSFSAVC